MKKGKKASSFLFYSWHKRKGLFFLKYHTKTNTSDLAQTKKFYFLENVNYIKNEWGLRITIWKELGKNNPATVDHKHNCAQNK